MSCIRLSGDERSWRKAQDAPPLPKSRIPKRCSKVARLYRLARDSRAPIRAAAAGNVDAPARLLRRLSVDESKLVRGWVARNPNTSRSTLRRLARGADPDVAAYARVRLQFRRETFLGAWFRFVAVRVAAYLFR